MTNVRATLAAVAILFISGKQNAVAEDSLKTDAELLATAKKQFQPLPKDASTADSPVTPERVSLGKSLFFDTRISEDGTVSCYRCHLAGLYGCDGLPTSIGAHDFHAPRNAPTVLNAGLQIAIHWRGEFKTVEEQAQKALASPVFGNKDEADLVARLKTVPGYAELFKKAFPSDANPVSASNCGKAVGAFERSLITPSRFDEYLAGKTETLTSTERSGLRLFLNVGCADCHQGAGVGGGSFEKFGVVEDYWKATDSKPIDQGRKDVTKQDSDQYVFKVSILRNVEMTAPYFHDGSVKTLPEAVKVMGRVQIGKTLSDDETASIVAFLKSLTAPTPKGLLEAPILPAGAHLAIP